MAVKIIRGVELETQLNADGVECVELCKLHNRNDVELLPLNHPKVRQVIDREVAMRESDT